MDAEEARTIGWALWRVRDGRGKSLRVVAGLAGMSKDTLNRIERGERSPTLSKGFVAPPLVRSMRRLDVCGQGTMARLRIRVTRPIVARSAANASATWGSRWRLPRRQIRWARRRLPWRA